MRFPVWLWSVIQHVPTSLFAFSLSPLPYQQPYTNGTVWLHPAVRVHMRAVSSAVTGNCLLRALPSLQPQVLSFCTCEVLASME